VYDRPLRNGHIVIVALIGSKSTHALNRTPRTSYGSWRFIQRAQHCWGSVEPGKGLKCPTSSNQVDDQHNYGDDKQNMNQAASHMETETQDPQKQKDYKNRPKHARSPFLYCRRPRQVCASGVSVYWMQGIG
jgi:hypothetical protein